MKIITLLHFGRGGSDTTAVAIAASIKADRCDIYTDVDGVFSSDPRIVDNVKKIDEISYDEMLELSSMGAKVLHNRCVEIGKEYNVPIIVKSTFKSNSKGTLVKGCANMEKLCIRGVTKDDNIVRIIIVGIDNKIGRMYQVFDLLAKNNISVDTIVKSVGEHAMKDISFTVKSSNMKKTVDVLKDNLELIEAKEIKICDNLSKISVIGSGMVNNPGVAARVFEALYENNIKMHMISTSEIKITVLVDKNNADIATMAIHKKFFIQ